MKNIRSWICNDDYLRISHTQKKKETNKEKKEEKTKKWKFRVQAREDSELIWVNYIIGKIPQTSQRSN